MFPLSLLVAIVRDPIAVSLLVSGLVLGYLLSNMSDRRTNEVYSAFWHRHRPALRAAIRRTPAPDAPMAAESASSAVMSS
jgi:hypothetical protein